jgi:hypothetical protein
MSLQSVGHTLPIKLLRAGMAAAPLVCEQKAGCAIRRGGDQAQPLWLTCSATRRARRSYRLPPWHLCPSPSALSAGCRSEAQAVLKLRHGNSGARARRSERAALLPLPGSCGPSPARPWRGAWSRDGSKHGPDARSLPWPSAPAIGVRACWVGDRTLGCIWHAKGVQCLQICP